MAKIYRPSNSRYRSQPAFLFARAARPHFSNVLMPQRWNIPWVLSVCETEGATDIQRQKCLSRVKVLGFSAPLYL